MPAKHLHRVDQREIYLHVYNRGIEGRNIFCDEEDFSIFISYLKEYLTKASNDKKTSFTVNGKTFKGTPHMPKNYYNKVELVSYILMPDHFHLVLDQRQEGSVQSFIRSICTRYSIYFNRKYQRKGSLFEGPYKSAHIKEANTLVHLITYLHTHHPNAKHSSSSIYAGKETQDWVKKDAVFSLFNNAENNNLGFRAYGEFAQAKRDELAERKILSEVLIEQTAQALERRDLANAGNSTVIPAPKITPEPKKKISRVPEYLALALLFVGLFDFGMTNIYVNTVKTYSKAKSVNSTQVAVAIKPTTNNKSQVLSASDSALLSFEDPSNILYSVVIVKEGVGEVNIYNEKSIDSEVVTTAIEGDTFTALPIDADWYEIRFTDKGTGYIESKYIKIKQAGN